MTDPSAKKRKTIWYNGRPQDAVADRQAEAVARDFLQPGGSALLFTSTWLVVLAGQRLVARGEGEVFDLTIENADGPGVHRTYTVNPRISDRGGGSIEGTLPRETGFSYAVDWSRDILLARDDIVLFPTAKDMAAKLQADGWQFGRYEDPGDEMDGVDTWWHHQGLRTSNTELEAAFQEVYGDEEPFGKVLFLNRLWSENKP